MLMVVRIASLIKEGNLRGLYLSKKVKLQPPPPHTHTHPFQGYPTFIVLTVNQSLATIGCSGEKVTYSSITLRFL